MEDRKKRLLEQRELIKKKKMEERKEELNAFVQNVKIFSYFRNKPVLSSASRKSVRKRWSVVVS